MTLQRSQKYIWSLIKNSPRGRLTVLILLAVFSQFSEFYWLKSLSHGIEGSAGFVDLFTRLGIPLLFLGISLFGPNIFMHIDAQFQKYILSRNLSQMANDCLNTSSQQLNSYPGLSAASDVRQAAQASKNIINFLTFDLVRAPVSIIFVSIYLYPLSKVLAFSVIIWCFIFLFVSLSSVRKNSILSRNLSTSITSTNAALTESLRNHKLFRISSYIAQEREFLENKIDTEMSHFLRMRSRLARAGLQLIGQRYLLVAGTAIYGILFLNQAKISVAQFLVLLQYNHLLIQIISNFSVRLLDIGNEFNILERSLESLDEINLLNTRDTRIQNLHRLEQLESVLKMPGQYVLTGNSGSGKTCLIENLYEKLISIYSAANIVYIPRETLILDRSIKENIYDIQSARKVESQLFQDSMSVLRDVDINATVLSAGEQQRINLIRLIKGDPVYILLDEATSSLDEVSSSQFYLSLFKTYPRAVILAVSHRQSEIKLFPVQIQISRYSQDPRLEIVSAPSTEEPVVF